MRRSSFEERPGVAGATAIVTEALASLRQNPVQSGKPDSSFNIGRKTGGEINRPKQPQIQCPDRGTYHHLVPESPGSAQST